MPRYGVWCWFPSKKSPDGYVPAHVMFNCKKSDLPKLCACGYASDFLCDYPVGNGKTCDKALCVKCRKNVGEEIDYCACHFKEWQEFKASQPSSLFESSQESKPVKPVNRGNLPTRTPKKKT